jgi:simple sugar transport system ATP-binding protein
LSRPEPQSLDHQGLEARGVSKTFGATKALVDVDFSVRPGEIVGLMGANGAGKSTLVNILSGIYPADQGLITLNGKPFSPRDPREAIHGGIVTIHQATDRAGAPGLTVADALVLDRLADGRTGLFVSRKSLRKQAEKIALDAGFDLPLDRDFGDLSTATRQLVAIARALSADPTVLILDEPTASLSGDEAEQLFAILERLAARGLAIIYISHRTGDLQRLSHRVTVLRGGRNAAEFRRPIGFSAALEAMIGRSLAALRPEPRAHSGSAAFKVWNLRLRDDSPALSFEIQPGEVLAITGPLGSGKSRLLNCLFGTERAFSGEIWLDGARHMPTSPTASIAAGIHLAGEDRKRTSFVPADWPGGQIAAAISQPHLSRWFPRGFIDFSRERSTAEAAIARLGIKASGSNARLDTLSGGNQQKVVLARWQVERPRLLLLDEPFQGVDVGARADIIRAIRSEASVATLIATSDAEEALEVADRVLVLDKRGLHPVQANLEPAFGT